MVIHMRSITAVDGHAMATGGGNDKLVTTRLRTRDGQQCGRQQHGASHDASQLIMRKTTGTPSCEGPILAAAIRPFAPSRPGHQCQN